MDSNHRPSGYEPDELPLLHAAMMGARTVSPSGQTASTLGAAVFHDPVRDGSGWVHRAPRTPLVQVSCGDRYPARVLSHLSPRTCPHREALVHAHASPLPLTRPPARAALPVFSWGTYPSHNGEATHLGAQFPLRCFQRFLLPAIATEPAGRPTTPPPAGRPRRSSRTERSPPQSPKRP
jgi:hypothetical protein